MQRVYFYLKIFLTVAIIIALFSNPKLTGNSILNIENFELNFSKILIMALFLGLILVFALEKIVEGDNTEIKKGEYHKIQYKFYHVPKSRRVILVAPGIGAKGLESDNATKVLAERLARRGISSIAFEIQRDENAPSPRRVVMDYLAMGNLAKKLGYSQVHGIYGSSLSGGPALVAAGRLGIKNIALRSPLVYFHELFNEVVKSKGGKPEEATEGWKKARRITKGEITLPYGLYEQFAKTDVDKVVNKLKGARIEITHGTNDEMVPIQYAEKAYQKLKDAGINVRLDKIEGAKHDYNRQHQKYALRRLTKSLI